MLEENTVLKIIHHQISGVKPGISSCLKGGQWITEEGGWLYWGSRLIVVLSGERKYCHHLAMNENVSEHCTHSKARAGRSVQVVPRDLIQCTFMVKRDIDSSDKALHACHSSSAYDDYVRSRVGKFVTKDFYDFPRYKL